MLHIAIERPVDVQVVGEPIKGSPMNLHFKFIKSALFRRGGCFFLQKLRIVDFAAEGAGFQIYDFQRLAARRRRHHV